VVTLLLVLSLQAWPANISREKLQEMFDRMARSAPWDLTKPVLWGYFFKNPTRAPLDDAVPLLASEGYRIVGVYPSKRNSASDHEVWWLHVERVELQTVDSLDARNHELNDFAREHGIAQYDGMDVGRAP
jgi:hypothetical protein